MYHNRQQNMPNKPTHNTLELTVIFNIKYAINKMFEQTPVRCVFAT